MEIIIHGKPNSDSSQSTSTIDSGLRDRITSYYFSKANISNNTTEMMAVELYNWKGTPYCVYNYIPGDNIRDTSGRPSYFVISVIMKGQYFRQVSDLFLHLRTVYQKVVSVNFKKKSVDEENHFKGKYLLANGKFLSNSFVEEPVVCSNILKAIDSKDFYYLTRSLDQNLNPRGFSDDTNFEKVSMLDCDSLDFMEVLKDKGRVIICETANSMRKQIEGAKSTEQSIRQKENEINRLTQQQVEKDGKIKELREEINNLSSNSTERAKAAENLLTENKDLKDALQAVADALEKVKLNKPSKSENTSHSHHAEPEPKSKNSWKGVKRFRNLLYAAAVVLVIALGAVSVAQIYPPHNPGDEVKVLNDSINKLNKLNKKLNDSIDKYKSMLGDAEGVNSYIDSLKNQNQGLSIENKNLKDQNEKLNKTVNEKDKKIKSLNKEITNLQKALKQAGGGTKPTTTQTPTNN